MAENNDTDTSAEETESTARRRSSDLYFALLMLALVVVAAAGFGAGLAVGSGQDDDEDTFAHELEVWADCLGEEGATVPAFTAHGDGSFTLDFDAGFFDDFRFERFLRAAGECRDIIPLEEMMELLGVPEEFLTPHRGFFERDAFPEDLREELERRAMSPLLELLGELPPGQRDRLCRNIFESDRLPVDDDDGLLRQLQRICERDE